MGYFLADIRKRLSWKRWSLLGLPKKSRRFYSSWKKFSLTRCWTSFETLRCPSLSILMNVNALFILRRILATFFGENKEAVLEKKMWTGCWMSLWPTQGAPSFWLLDEDNRSITTGICDVRYFVVFSNVSPPRPYMDWVSSTLSVKSILQDPFLCVCNFILTTSHF